MGVYDGVGVCCDGSVSNWMGCVMEFVANMICYAMGCVCKKREFLMGWGLIWDEVGFDMRWGVFERKEGFRWVGYNMGWGLHSKLGNEVQEGNLGRKLGYSE
ncbi:unnamed protein product [Prunus armeniaca]